MDREHYGEALFVPRKPTCLPSLALSTCFFILPKLI